MPHQNRLEGRLDRDVPTGDTVQELRSLRPVTPPPSNSRRRSCPIAAALMLAMNAPPRAGERLPALRGYSHARPAQYRIFACGVMVGYMGRVGYSGSMPNSRSCARQTLTAQTFSVGGETFFFGARFFGGLTFGVGAACRWASRSSKSSTYVANGSAVGPEDSQAVRSLPGLERTPSRGLM